MIDMHIHSLNSFDGTMSIEEIINVSQELGIKILSLTDHDNIDGIKDFIKLGNKKGIKTIPGVEISTLLKANIQGLPFFARIHILGYNFDYSNPDMQKTFDEVFKKENDRWNDIAHYLRLKKSCQISNKTYYTRDDLISSLMDTGSILNLSKLGDGSSWY